MFGVFIQPAPSVLCKPILRFRFVPVNEPSAISPCTLRYAYIGSTEFKLIFENDAVDADEPLTFTEVISKTSVPPAETFILSADDSRKCVLPPPSRYNLAVAGTPAPVVKKSKAKKK